MTTCGGSEDANTPRRDGARSHVPHRVCPTCHSARRRCAPPRTGRSGGGSPSDRPARLDPGRFVGPLERLGLATQPLTVDAVVATGTADWREPFAGELAACAAHERALTLDLRSVRFMDSSGLRLLFRLRVLAEAGPAVRAVGERLDVAQLARSSGCSSEPCGSTCASLRRRTLSVRAGTAKIIAAMSAISTTPPMTASATVTARIVGCVACHGYGPRRTRDECGETKLIQRAARADAGPAPE